MSTYIVQRDYSDPKNNLFIAKGKEVEGEFKGKTNPNSNDFVRVWISADKNKFVDLIDGYHVKLKERKPDAYGTSSMGVKNTLLLRFKNDISNRKFYYGSSAIIGLTSGYAFSKFYKKAPSKEVLKVSVICMLSAVIVMGAISLSKQD